MPKKKRKLPTSASFKVGDKVRVKHGVKDVDYPDMPLGGGAGTVTEAQGADTFTVRWTEETMEAIHPVFKQRCEIDGLDPEEYVLTGDDPLPVLDAYLQTAYGDPAAGRVGGQKSQAEPATGQGLLLLVLELQVNAATEEPSHEARP